jgi:hypothetical protein
VIGLKDVNYLSGGKFFKTHMLCFFLDTTFSTAIVNYSLMPYKKAELCPAFLLVAALAIACGLSGASLGFYVCRTQPGGYFIFFLF